MSKSVAIGAGAALATLAVAGVGVWWAVNRFGPTLRRDLDITSTDNVLYRNIGGDDWSIGTKFHDWLNW